MVPLTLQTCLIHLDSLLLLAAFWASVTHFLLLWTIPCGYPKRTYSPLLLWIISPECCRFLLRNCFWNHKDYSQYAHTELPYHTHSTDFLGYLLSLVPLKVSSSRCLGELVLSSPLACSLGASVKLHCGNVCC